MAKKDAPTPPPVRVESPGTSVIIKSGRESRKPHDSGLRFHGQGQ